MIPGSVYPARVRKPFPRTRGGAEAISSVNGKTHGANRTVGFYIVSSKTGSTAALQLGHGHCSRLRLHALDAAELPQLGSHLRPFVEPCVLKRQERLLSVRSHIADDEENFPDLLFLFAETAERTDKSAGAPKQQSAGKRTCDGGFLLELQLRFRAVKNIGDLTVGERCRVLVSDGVLQLQMVRIERDVYCVAFAKLPDIRFNGEIIADDAAFLLLKNPIAAPPFVLGCILRFFTAFCKSRCEMCS